MHSPSMQECELVAMRVGLGAVHADMHRLVDYIVDQCAHLVDYTIGQTEHQLSVGCQLTKLVDYNLVILTVNREIDFPHFGLFSPPGYKQKDVETIIIRSNSL